MIGRRVLASMGQRYSLAHETLEALSEIINGWLNRCKVQVSQPLLNGEPDIQFIADGFKTLWEWSPVVSHRAGAIAATKHPIQMSASTTPYRAANATMATEGSSVRCVLFKAGGQEGRKATEQAPITR